MDSKLAKDKLDKALGIDPGGSIDDILGKLDLDTDEYKSTFEEIGNKVQDTISGIDKNIEIIKNNGISSVESEILDLNNSLKQVSDLISISKGIITHLYNVITSSELVDAELIGSSAAFITAAQSSISEYIALYKDRMKFYDAVRLRAIDHNNKMEEIRFREELVQKRNQPAAEVENMQAFRQEDITRMLQDMEDNSEKVENSEEDTEN